jgi:hypothetical protein
MFKVVASFARENSDHNFFYYDNNQHPIVVTILETLKNTQGFLGLFEIIQEDCRHDIALGFETVLDFQTFAQNNQKLLNARQQLIEEYCQRTGHVYKYYMIENEDKQ